MLCIILRGAPGSGKSTWAANYANYETAPCWVVSTDKFFINDNGEYIFDVKKLGYNHRLAFEEFQRAVNERFPTVILDNTNIRIRDYKKYVDTARNTGYTIVQKVFNGGYVNTHGVPLEKVEEMRQRFQEDTELPPFKEESRNDFERTT